MWWSFVLLLILPTALFGAPPTPGLARLSKTEREQIEARGAAYVRALNAADSTIRRNAALDLFARSTLEQVGADRLVGQMASVRERFGELEYHHSELIEMEASGAMRRSLHVYARASGSSRWNDLQFVLEPSAPYRLDKLAFIAEVAEPVYLPNGAITDLGTLDWLNGYVDKLARKNDLAGSVLVAKGDSVIFERYFGYADQARTREVDSATRFNLGSGNKMFTSLAIAQLIERGRLKLTDPISPWFADFPDSAFARRVTVGHLLSHTSGVRDFWTDDYSRARPALDSLRDLLPWVYQAGTSFEPGSQREYSNSNFALAGLIVEQVAGQDYYRVVSEKVYQPLGMRESGSYHFDDKRVPLAEPLQRSGTGWRTEARSGRGGSAGGGYSTCRDMLRFTRGLVSGKVVTRETLAWMTRTSPVATPGSFDCGYGFLLNAEGQVPSFGHGGITAGVNFELRYFPSEDITFVAFSNQDNGAYDDLRKNVIRLVTGAR